MDKNEKEVASDEPKYRGIKAMPFVIGNETFEKLGTIGTSSNLLVYLVSVFHMKSISATNLVNVFNGTCNFGTLAGAYLCDTYFGRYKTLGFASVASFLGMLVLTLTAAVAKLHPKHCQNDTVSCKGATPGQMTFLITGFGFLIVGASGIRPCNLAFGADQFNPNTSSGKRAISSFFNWYYFTYTFAMMASLTAIVYVQSDVSWSLGLAIPTFLMFLSCALFFLGTRLYVKVKPEGSPLTSVVQVIVVAIRKRGLNLPEQPWLSLFNQNIDTKSINSKLQYTKQFRFLNKAAIITEEDQINTDGSAANPWRLCSIQQVEEVKCLVRLIPIWFAGIIYSIVVVQQQNYSVFQALQSDRRFGNIDFKIPAASYVVFQMLSLSLWIPIYDRLLVPFLRRRTKIPDGITLLQKMGIGLILACLAMLSSALVEDKRRTLALTKPTLGFDERKGAISSMSGFWLIPQLALTGLSEAFFFIAENEFVYKQVPENMRSIGASFVFCGVAMSSYLSSFLSSVVDQTTKNSKKGSWLAEDLNKGRLDYFYYLIAALEVINFGYFLFCAKWYRYKGTDDIILEVDMVETQSEKATV